MPGRGGKQTGARPFLPYHAGMPTVPDRKAQAKEVIRRLRGEYPDAHIVLNFGNDWELLVAVMLSAQTTDVTVNKVTTNLFKKYRTVEDYASASQAEFEQDVHATGFFRNKAKHVIGAAQKILADYGGEVPASMEELLTLPGVARKTANIVLGNAYPEAYATDPDAGIAVDTHVNRLSQRLGLAASSDSGEDRAGTDGDRAPRRLVRAHLPADRARPRGLRRRSARAAGTAC